MTDLFPAARSLSLDKLMAELTARLAGRECTVSWIDRYDGSQLAVVRVSGKLFAAWTADLESPPVFDGKTPRGPKRYHSLRFYDGPEIAGSN